MGGQHDDATLVAAAQRGDRAALEQLLARHYDRVFAVCRRITANPDDAADAAQEALVSIVRHLDRFDGRSSFGTWAYRIATNASLDELRRRRRRPLLERGEHPGDDSSVHDRHADHEAERRLEAVTDHAVLDAALRGLAEDFRVPVVLRDVADLDYAEIAGILGVPVGTVKSRIARGRAALAATLGDERAGNHTPLHRRPSSEP